ncbi:hypothetical protein SAMN05446037_1004176 [Anaerovirgula multivorans]|uniref:Uncharacterized protein n=1 Tax=Anaerovirgula multivorans TaxID=312168 RepID=A0A239BWC6_9FIRM|nr:hypothetical protein [Anaerovirgula multivorans]SNS12190.1 hypothetical protein SAMN05446037_1004176 [Anaerovirgula multivorans]
MDIWRANLIECIKEIERAREDTGIDQDRYEALGEIIIELQDIVED